MLDRCVYILELHDNKPRFRVTQSHLPEIDFPAIKIKTQTRTKTTTTHKH